MKKKNNLGAIGLEILIVPVVAIAAVIFFSNTRVEPFESKEPVLVENPKNDLGSEVVQPKEDDGKLDIVTSLEDAIDEDAAWCGTFNLIWNDLRDELAKQDIVFEEQTQIVENLNKGTFNVSCLSEDSYYKAYDHPTLEFKKEIENAIKKKFNEKSDILNSFKWTGNKTSYFLYCMLKKEFEFPKVFSKLGTEAFGNNQTAQYFGIDVSTDDSVRGQVRVLYYNSKNDFAVKLLTKQNDEVIVTVGCEKNSFGEIYASVLNNADKYKGSRRFNNMDELKIPNIKFDLKETITEVMNKPFFFADGREYVIDQALQTIKFELDEKGGRIKSEAGMMVSETTAIIEPPQPRLFYVDEAFTIFLIEEGRELPYFAAKISDIDNIQ